MKKFKRLIATLLVTMMLASCATALYDQYAFTETLNTKAQTLTLIETSTQDYEDHLEDVRALQNQIRKMITYEKTRSKNEITVKMWEYMNKDESALQQFIKTWEAQERMNAVFTEEFKPQIEKAYDLLIDYESKKDKQSEGDLLQFLNN